MFTGLVEAMVRVSAIEHNPPGIKLILDLSQDEKFMDGVKIGDSISINGCCLTVIAICEQLLAFEAGEETLKRTNLGSLISGSHVNVERSLCLGDRLGGHLVTGHIDGQGTLSRRVDDGQWSYLYFDVDPVLMRQMVSKGSIAVDGVSLTLVDVTNTSFSVALIPHTLAVTTLGKLSPGDRVNLETDLLAKYVQRQLEGLTFSPSSN